MNNSTAKQIADLLNRRNNLPNKIRDYDIFRGGYFYVDIEVEGGKRKVVSCVRAKRISFFAYELKHLSVSEDYQSKGLGSLMINMVESYVQTKKIPLIVATTNILNDPVNHLFGKLKYQRTKEFVNSNTNNKCYLWQKFVNLE